MGKILVGRDGQKEVEMGYTSVDAKQSVSSDAEKKEELAEAPVENEQVVAAEEGDVPEEKEAVAKRRGKKRAKA